MTVPVELTDEVLLRRMIAGEEGAFTALYRRRQPAIYRFALRMSGSRAMAEDVTQEVFMALIRDAKRYDAARGPFGAFLFGIARNHLHKRWEAERRLVPSGLGGEEFIGDGSGEGVDGARMRMAMQSGNGNGAKNGSGNGFGGAGNGMGNGGRGVIPSLPEEFASRETVKLVRKAVDGLPENYREAVVLCDLEEMTYEEAAEAAGCPVGTIRSRLHRGRAILLEKLSETKTVGRAPAVGE
jgi:RNA polymerase sigma-70 factor (ECF subfamily)